MQWRVLCASADYFHWTRHVSLLTILTVISMGEHCGASAEACNSQQSNHQLGAYSITLACGWAPPLQMASLPQE